VLATGGGLLFMCVLIPLCYDTALILLCYDGGMPLGRNKGIAFVSASRQVLVGLFSLVCGLKAGDRG
jgi:hypothetical protein